VLCFLHNFQMLTVFYLEVAMLEKKHASHLQPPAISNTISDIAQEAIVAEIDKQTRDRSSRRCHDV
jgi:hypothetical protein